MDPLQFTIAGVLSAALSALWTMFIKDKQRNEVARQKCEDDNKVAQDRIQQLEIAQAFFLSCPNIPCPAHEALKRSHEFPKTHPQ